MFYDCLQGVVINSGTVRMRHVRSSADGCSQLGLTTFNVTRAPSEVELDFPMSKTGSDCTSEQLQDARATYRPRGIGLNDSTVFGTGSCAWQWKCKHNTNFYPSSWYEAVLTSTAAFVPCNLSNGQKGQCRANLIVESSLIKRGCTADNQPFWYFGRTTAPVSASCHHQ